MLLQAPIHVSISHTTKFGWISSNGLGGDSTTDSGIHNIPPPPPPNTFFLKKEWDYIL